MESERSALPQRSEEHRSRGGKSGAISEMIPGGDGGDFALDEQSWIWGSGTATCGSPDRRLEYLGRPPRGGGVLAALA